MKVLENISPIVGSIKVSKNGFAPSVTLPLTRKHVEIVGIDWSDIKEELNIDYMHTHSDVAHKSRIGKKDLFKILRLLGLQVRLGVITYRKVKFKPFGLFKEKRADSLIIEILEQWQKTNFNRHSK